LVFQRIIIIIIILRNTHAHIRSIWFDLIFLSMLCHRKRVSIFSRLWIIFNFAFVGEGEEWFVLFVFVGSTLFWYCEWERSGIVDCLWSNHLKERERGRTVGVLGGGLTLLCNDQWYRRKVHILLFHTYTYIEKITAYDTTKQRTLVSTWPFLRRASQPYTISNRFYWWSLGDQPYLCSISLDHSTLDDMDHRLNWPLI